MLQSHIYPQQIMVHCSCTLMDSLFPQAARVSMGELRMAIQFLKGPLCLAARFTIQSCG